MAVPPYLHDMLTVAAPARPMRSAVALLCCSCRAFVLS